MTFINSLFYGTVAETSISLNKQSVLHYVFHIGPPKDFQGTSEAPLRVLRK